MLVPRCVLLRLIQSVWRRCCAPPVKERELGHQATCSCDNSALTEHQEDGKGAEPRHLLDFECGYIYGASKCSGKG